MVMRTQGWLVLLLMATLAGCYTPAPKPGEIIYLKIDEPVKLPFHPTSSAITARNALTQGLSREDIEKGRLGFAECAEQTAAGPKGRLWVVTVPESMHFPPYWRMEPFAEIVPGVGYAESGPLGRAIAKTPAPQEKELAQLSYRKLVRCDATNTPGALRAELTKLSDRFWLTDLEQQDGWTRALPKDAVADGRVYDAHCALGTDYTRSWYVLALPGQVLSEGQLIKARAGTAVDDGPGALSQVLELNLKGYRTEKVFSRPVISCSQ
ncbi:hypothetical protein NX773_19470 [Massilia solisilvae]|uniref:Lipoprotein n=1 Tax=Massilia solisilvae TaxID=1811225 RepID=A0ABT2BPM4_9BURK|nr:hypothetical protein [Massilia solisilvae]MCS0610351.1 hypothetical protein [Massilia solisilvae]